MSRLLFDYLKLSLDERIEFKDREGLTLVDICNGPKENYLSGELCGRKEVKEALGICAETVRVYRNKGVLGKKCRDGNKYSFKVSDINRVLREHTRSIPVAYFVDVLDDYYLSEKTFKDRYSGCFISRIDGKRAIPLIDSYKTLRKMRERKKIVESWKTFEELSRDLGGSVLPKSLIKYFKKGIDCKNYRVIHILHSPNGAGRAALKIHPEDYAKMLRERQDKQKGLSIQEISEKYKIHRVKVWRRVVYAEEKKLIVPRTGPDAGRVYTLTEHDAAIVCDPKLKGYTPRRDSGNKIIFSGDYKMAEAPKPLDKKTKFALTSLGNRVDSDAISYLMKLYELEISEAARPKIYGMSFEDRRSIGQSFFFELIAHEGAHDLIGLNVVENIRTRIRESIKYVEPLWISLNKEVGRKYERPIELVNIISEDRRLNLKP